LINFKKQKMEEKTISWRTNVFEMAQIIAREEGTLSWVNLSKAWKVYRLKKAMKSGIVEFMFRKVDGTIRCAKGTLSGIEYEAKGGYKKSAKSVSYWDIEANGFRSFKPENFIASF